MLMPTDTFVGGLSNVMAGDVKRAEQDNSFKFITNSFEATQATIQKIT
jgi:hypothetical protein